MSTLKKTLANEYKKGVEEKHFGCLEFTGKVHAAILKNEKRVFLGKTYNNGVSHDFSCDEYAQLLTHYKNDITFERSDPCHVFNSISFKYDHKTDKVISSYDYISKF